MARPQWFIANVANLVLFVVGTEFGWQWDCLCFDIHSFLANPQCCYQRQVHLWLVQTTWQSSIMFIFIYAFLCQRSAQIVFFCVCEGVSSEVHNHVHVQLRGNSVLNVQHSHNKEHFHPSLWLMVEMFELGSHQPFPTFPRRYYDTVIGSKILQGNALPHDSL